MATCPWSSSVAVPSAMVTGVGSVGWAAMAGCS